MTKRLLSTAAAVCAMGLVPRHPASAQAPARTAEPAYSVIKSVATSDEQSLVQGMITRLRTKTADPSLAKSLEAAATRRDYPAAHRIVADVLGVKPNQVVLALNKSVGLAPVTGTPFFLASRHAHLNPWTLLFTISGKLYCASFSSAECTDLLHKLGYTDISVIK